MIKLTFLGTGAALPSIHHCNLSLLIEASSSTPSRGSKSRMIVVDAGPSVVVQLAKLNVDLLNIDDVVLTHKHGDHVLGFPMLVIGWYILRRQRPVEVYGPTGIADALRTITTTCYPEAAEFYAKTIHVTELPADAPHSTEPAEGTYRLHTAPVVHSVPTLGVRFNFANQRSITFSGDTTPAPAVAELAQGSSILVHDATYSERLEPDRTYPVHSTAREAGRIAAAAQVEMLALVHLSASYEGHESVLQAEAAEFFRGNVLVPQDLDTIMI